jgi:REP element-mobilizing transposase RayT
MRIEVEGGLYHIITRGVARQDIFHDANDHARFMKLLAGLKERLPFYLYAYCLMRRKKGGQAFDSSILFDLRVVFP